MAGTGKKRQKKGRFSHQTSKVAESTRIRIGQILEHFRISNDEVYTFQDDLKNHERAAVHVLCKKMGMKSKSSGRGEQRRVSVYKLKKRVGPFEGKENLVSFRFSKDAKDVLQDLFSRYPPNDAEAVENKIKESSGNMDTVQAKRDDMFCKPVMSIFEIANKVDSLASRIEKDPNLRQIAEKRSKLPIASFRDSITSTIESHQVVLICGETGCGKTTQVPQFLLDHAWSKGETCKIVCTQPRRISASSVAERIASERGENVGDTVAYKIRLENKGGKHSSLVFCTNGVLLRVLVGKGTSRTKKKASRRKAGLAFEITHIVVDEIHERDRFSDFILAIIRDMLHSHPRLRLVLMSATIDAERFSKYFGDCPIIRVPGFTYPVKTFYLEDVLSIVGSTENNHLSCMKECETMENATLTEEYRTALDEAMELALSNDEFDLLLELISSEGDPKIFNYQHSKTGATPLMVFAQKGRVGDVCMLLSFGVDCHLRTKAGKTALECAEQDNQVETAEIIRKHVDKTFSCSAEEQRLLDRYISKVDPELIDCVLIEQLLRRICSDSEDGAILIFLPGWDDINRTREKLLNNCFFKDSSKYLIMSLHSMVPSLEQKKAFKRPPLGCRKIILSTNIAETSVTIEDVVYVIDSGRMKEKSYDPYNNVSTLQSSWISKASAKQREGRAGRCQPGICYHLYSKLRASSLPDFQVPEIKRMPIEELCLQVKLFDPSCIIEEFLQKILDPPVYESIRNAIVVLQDIGALSPDEKLTELGEKLGSLPVHPLTSKMLFLAILLNCLDPALTLACAADYRDPFALPVLPDEKNRAAAAKLELASFYGGHGDQIAVIAAFECWMTAKEKGEEARFCSQYFITKSTMTMISGMRMQLKAELIRNGYVPENASHCSLNARDPGILHAVLVAGLYPMVGKLLPPNKNVKRSAMDTAGGCKVRLNPHSTNFKLSSKKFSAQPLFIFDEITRGDGGLLIRNCSIVGPLPLLLLATEIVVAPANENEEEDDESDYEDADADADADTNVNADADADDSDEYKTESYDLPNSKRGEKIMSSPENSVKVIVDRWLPFESMALDVAQIYCLRERLFSAILFKATHPQKVLPAHLGASLFAVACILSFDGMSGVSLPLEPVDSLTKMISATDIGQGNHGNKMEMNRSPKNYPLYEGRHQNPASHNQKGNAPATKFNTNWSNASPYHNEPPISTVGTNRNQNLPSEGSTATAHETANSGTSATKRNRSKRRRRGNGPK